MGKQFDLPIGGVKMTFRHAPFVKVSAYKTTGCFGDNMKPK